MEAKSAVSTTGTRSGKKNRRVIDERADLAELVQHLKEEVTATRDTIASRNEELRNVRQALEALCIKHSVASRERTPGQ